MKIHFYLLFVVVWILSLLGSATSPILTAPDSSATSKVYLPYLNRPFKAIGGWGGRSMAVAGNDRYLFVGEGHEVVIYDTNSLTIAGNQTNAKEIATIPVAGNVHYIDLNGTMLYVAAGIGGLVTIDISQPDKPYIVSQLDGFVNYIAHRNTIAYALGNEQLWVISLDQPNNPRLLVQHTIDDTPAQAVYVLSDPRFIILANKGLQITMFNGATAQNDLLDLRDINQPRLITRWNGKLIEQPELNQRDIFDLYEDLLIRRIDASNPLVAVGKTIELRRFGIDTTSLRNYSEPYQLLNEDTLLTRSRNLFKVIQIDRDVPNKRTEVSIDLNYYWQDCYVGSDLLLFQQYAILNCSHALFVINLQDPLKPKTIYDQPIFRSTPHNFNIRLLPSGPLLSLVGDNQRVVMRLQNTITQLINPIYIAETVSNRGTIHFYPIGKQALIGSRTDFYSQGNPPWVVLDLSNPAAPQFQQSIDQNLVYDSMSQRIYWIDTDGFKINKLNPQGQLENLGKVSIWANYIVPATPHLVILSHLSGSYPYQSKTISLIDLTDVAHPTIASQITSTLDAVGHSIVTQSSKYLVLHENIENSLTQRYVFYNISNPKKPTYLGKYETSSYGISVKILDDDVHILFGDGNTNHKMIDLRTTPIRVSPSILPIINHYTRLIRWFDRIAVDSGYFLIDASNAASPQKRGRLPFWDQKESKLLTIANNMAYMSANDRLYIVDIQNLDAPTLIHTYPPEHWVKDCFRNLESRDVALTDDFLYVSSFKCGLTIFTR